MGQQKTVDKLWGMGAAGGSGSGQNGGAAAKQGGAGDFDDLLL
jgi:epsin